MPRKSQRASSRPSARGRAAASRGVDPKLIVSIVQIKASKTH